MNDEQLQELYSDDDPEDLARQYWDTVKQLDKRSSRRFWFFLAGYCLFLFVLLCYFIKPPNFIAGLAVLLLALFLSCVFFFAHYFAFQWFFSQRLKENKQKEFLETRLRWLADRVSQMSCGEMAEMIARRFWFYTGQLYGMHYGNPRGLAFVWAAVLYSVQDPLNDLRIFPFVDDSFTDTCPSNYESYYSIGPEMRMENYHLPSHFYQAFVDADFNLSTEKGMKEFFFFVAKGAGHLDLSTPSNREVALGVYFDAFCDIIFRAKSYVKYFQVQRGPKYSPNPFESRTLPDFWDRWR